jgi:hypothetical protein
VVVYFHLCDVGCRMFNFFAFVCFFQGAQEGFAVRIYFLIRIAKCRMRNVLLNFDFLLLNFDFRLPTLDYRLQASS